MIQSTDWHEQLLLTCNPPTGESSPSAPHQGPPQPQPLDALTVIPLYCVAPFYCVAPLLLRRPPFCRVGPLLLRRPPFLAPPPSLLPTAARLGFPPIALRCRHPRLQRLEAVDEAVHRTDLSSAMMEEKVCFVGGLRV